VTGADDTGDGGDGGGDPVCWAHLLCPECGAVPDRPGDDHCARCGAEFPPADD
jgi:hypothetical protein